MSYLVQSFVDWFMSSSTLTKLTVVDFGIQWTGFAVASYFQTEKFYDLTGSSTFLLVIYLAYKWHSNGHSRQMIQTGCVSMWALRLGLYLFTRILKDGRDRRFDKTRSNPSRFFFAWTIQGVWVLVTLLPSLLAIMSPRQRPLSTRDYAGWGIWLIGYLIEVVADYQKSSFRNNPANKDFTLRRDIKHLLQRPVIKRTKGNSLEADKWQLNGSGLGQCLSLLPDKFINSGLWALSRHPNYFGEIMLWFGLYISASSNFSGWEYFTILCPLLDYLLITKVSGIPMLENYARKKWGLLQQYQEYVEKTPVLVPFFG